MIISAPIEVKFGIRKDDGRDSHRGA